MHYCSVDATHDLEVTVNNMGTYALGDEDLDGETLVDQIYDALMMLTDGDDDFDM